MCTTVVEKQTNEIDHIRVTERRWNILYILRIRPRKPEIRGVMRAGAWQRMKVCLLVKMGGSTLTRPRPGIPNPRLVLCRAGWPLIPTTIEDRQYT
jgi:hypothetical protein